MAGERGALDETGYFPRPPRPHHPLASYLLALVAVSTATTLSLLVFAGLPSPRPLAFFYIAVATAAWYGGLFPGLFATLSSVVVVWSVYEPHLLPSGEVSGETAANMALFLVVGSVFSSFSEALHRSRRDIEASARERIGLERARRAAEQAAWESERRFRVGAEAAPIMLWLSGPDRLRTYCNRVWLDFTGRSLERELGDGWFEGVHPDDRPTAREIYAASFDARQAFRHEYRLRRHDGGYRWILEAGAPRHDAEGNFAGYIGSCMDVHEQKQALRDRDTLLETARQALARAEESARMRDEFLATVSHELRNPLNAIVGWAHLLQMGTADDEEKERALETIVRSAHSQARLVDDLLDVSRVISGKMRLSVEAIDLATVVETAIAAARPQADAKGVRLMKTLDSAATVLGDAARLQQIVGNLIDNATKFTPAGGRVQVAVRAEGSHVELSVADSGQGIAADFLPEVFDLFRQAETGSRRRHGGMGLGLAIVRQLVELHGGSVRAESAGEGRGATFTVSLPMAVLSRSQVEPRATARAAADGGCAAPGVDLTGVTVLVIEDDEDTRRLLDSLLTACGARVIATASVAEAMAALERELPSVILSDIEMPGESGYDFIRQLRALPAEKGGRLPVAALTAYARSEDRRRALGAGFQLHAVKPIEPEELVTILANLAGRPPISGPAAGNELAPRPAPQG